jgi:hypothetical protein
LSALGVPAAGTLLQLWGALPTNEIIPTGNFLDPDVQRWSNIDFAEHYYQILASPTALPVGGGIVSTPNGRFVPNFDVSINLNGRAGFTVDDGLATLTALSDGSLRPGGPHSRVWRWYGATTDLSAVNFDKAGEPVYRRLADKEAIEFQGVASPGTTRSRLPSATVPRKASVPAGRSRRRVACLTPARRALSASR